MPTSIAGIFKGGHLVWGLRSSGPSYTATTYFPAPCPQDLCRRNHCIPDQATDSPIASQGQDRPQALQKGTSQALTSIVELPP